MFNFENQFFFVGHTFFSTQFDEFKTISQERRKSSEENLNPTSYKLANSPKFLDQTAMKHAACMIFKHVEIFIVNYNQKCYEKLFKKMLKNCFQSNKLFFSYQFSIQIFLKFFARTFLNENYSKYFPWDISMYTFKNIILLKRRYEN